MSVTHGGRAKIFQWQFHNNQIIITNQDGRNHLYSVVEIYNIMNWLNHRFNYGWFPLANNVEKLGNGSEIDGLGVAILRQRPRDITHAQGSSYLGVVLEEPGMLEWNGKARGIKWRIIHRPRNVRELQGLLDAKNT